MGCGSRPTARQAWAATYEERIVELAFTWVDGSCCRIRGGYGRGAPARVRMSDTFRAPRSDAAFSISVIGDVEHVTACFAVHGVRVVAQQGALWAGVAHLATGAERGLR